MKLWSHGTSSAVIDTQLKEWDKIIFAKSSLISFVGYQKKSTLSMRIRECQYPPGVLPYKSDGGARRTF